MVGTGTTRSDLASWWGLPAYRLAQCGFGSVRFRFLVFAIGPVRFMFGFGSCGSWSISVRCLEHSTLIFAFFPAPEKQIQIASCKRFIASRKRFHEPRLSKSGESWFRKTKASWNCQCMQFIMKKPILFFSLNSKNNYNIYNFSNQFIGGGQDGSGSSGSVLHTGPAVHGSYGS